MHVMHVIVHLHECLLTQILLVWQLEIVPHYRSCKRFIVKFIQE